MIKRKKKSISDIEIDRVGAARMKLFYDLLWSKLPKDKRCTSCNIPIYGDNKPLYWDHLIEQQKRPDLIYEEGNMYFCCGECHQLKTNGYPNENHKQAMMMAKEKYINLK